MFFYPHRCDFSPSFPKTSAVVSYFVSLNCFFPLLTEWAAPGLCRVFSSWLNSHFCTSNEKREKKKERKMDCLVRKYCRPPARGQWRETLHCWWSNPGKLLNVTFAIWLDDEGKVCSLRSRSEISVRSLEHFRHFC